MNVDYLIIGQGVAGTWLSYYLQKAGYSFLVIDAPPGDTASRIAAGIVNPVTGRRIVKTWMIDEVLPFVSKAYTDLGNELGITAIETKPIIDFHATVQMKLAFEERFAKEPDYLKRPEDEWYWKPHFNYDLGYFTVDPCYFVRLDSILPAWRKLLEQKGQLREARFEQEKLQVKEDHIKYEDITAGHIIFCDGIGSYDSPLFQRLPFALTKGEAIWIEAKDIPQTNIFKKGMMLVPWAKDVFWVGSTYEWDFPDDKPTEAFREKTIAQLKHWLPSSFRVLDHKASIRPGTVERRPFIGWHPQQPRVGIVNGFGTKGCSLGPWFAREFVEHIQNGAAIHPEAQIHRFSKVLSRP